MRRESRYQRCLSRPGESLATREILRAPHCPRKTHERLARRGLGALELVADDLALRLARLPRLLLKPVGERFIKTNRNRMTHMSKVYSAASGEASCVSGSSHR